MAVENNLNTKGVKISKYFIDTPPEGWEFIGFYEYHQRERHFTNSFKKESFRLRRSIDYLLENGPKEAKFNIDRLDKNFKKHRLNDKDSKLFWDRIESQLTFDAEIETKEREMRLAEVGTATGIMKRIDVALNDIRTDRRVPIKRKTLEDYFVTSCYEQDQPHTPPHQIVPSGVTTWIQEDKPQNDNKNLGDPIGPSNKKKLRYEKDECEEKLGHFAMRSNENRLVIETDIEEEEPFTIEDFEESLAEANIINISSDKSLANKELFNELKVAAKFTPLPHINLDGLKKWIKENYARKIETTLSNLQATTEIKGLDSEQFNLARRVLEIKLMQLRAGYGEKLDCTMDENTYTSTIVSPDFEILKFCFPYLFISRWNENEVPSSKWRRQLVYNTSSHARKADGILFNYDRVNQEFLLFENIGPPSRTLNPKYRKDLLKSFRNSVDAICETFWKNKSGDAKIASKYYVLTYVLHKREGELFRINLAAPNIFVAERILKVNYPFEYATFSNIIDIVELLLTVKNVIESNKDVLHNYIISCMEESKNFPLVKDWLCLNEKTP